ncbi:hypothetical protein C0J52_00088 [Blattella germanica]|nr:hypothetical protein C0J52_00088 [Blattella germanica]
MLWFAFLFVVAHVSAQHEKLVLTDYIDAGNASKAKLASKVTSDNLLASQVESYSGFFRTSTNPSRHLFFWFFPCENVPQEKPLLLWLKGSPGESAMIGIMEEFGPFVLNENATAVTYNDKTWTKDFNILFVDITVGTGTTNGRMHKSRVSVTSYANYTSDEGLAQSVVEVANHLRSVLVQFFTVFTEFRRNAFYIVGETFGGKCVPVLSLQIDEYNRNSSTAMRINLQGGIIMNGYLDPKYQVKLNVPLREWGIISYIAQNYLDGEERSVLSYAERNDFELAYDLWIDHFYYTVTTTRYYSLYNALDAHYVELGNKSGKFVMSRDVKRALHVGDAIYSPRTNLNGGSYMTQEYVQSVKSALERTLNNHRVLIVAGNLDLMLPPALNEQLLKDLDFNGRATYREAVRYKWTLDGKVMGYKKQAVNLNYVVLRNCGHFIARDCPRQANQAIKQFLFYSLF